MKKLLIGIIAVLAFVLTISSALAAAPTVSLTSPSDNAADTDGSVTFKYNVNDDLGSVSSCSLLIGGSVDQTDTSIASTANAATENTFSKSGLSDGTYTWNVQCTDNESNTVSGTARTLDVSISHLEIKDIKVYVDGDKHDDIDEDCATSSSNCDIDEEVHPGSEIKLIIEFENTWDDNDDDKQDIEDIKTTVEIDDSDFGDDVDEDDEINSIDPEEEDKTEIVFTIPSDAEDGTYDMDITIEAEEEDDGPLDDITFTFDLEVDRESYDFRIQRADLGVSTLRCTRKTNIDIKVENYGSEDDDEVAVLVTNSDLGLNFKEKDIDLENYDEDDDDNEWRKLINIDVPEDLRAGTYPIKVKVYYSGDEDDGVLGDDKTVSLTVEDCKSSAESTTTNTGSEVEVINTSPNPLETIANNNQQETTTNKQQTTTTTPSQTTTTTPSQGTQGYTDVTNTVEDRSFVESGGYLVILAIAVISTIGFGVLLILKFLA